MFKKTFLLLTLLGIFSSKGATISRDLVSSNQFKGGTNGIYTAALANLGTLSNSFLSTHVSSNNLLNLNWPTLHSSAFTTDTSTITNGLSVGGGSVITKILSTTATLDFPATTTNQISTLNITLNQAGTNGCVFLNIVSPDTNFTYTAVISSTNTVTVRAANISTNDAVNPAPTSARVVVFQF